MRAGLMTAIAFPLAVGDDCDGVIEFLTAGRQRAQRRDLGDVRHGRRPARAVPRAPPRRSSAESRRLHAQLDRTRGFLDAAGALIVVLDREGCVLLANARACAVVGVDEAEMIGRDWFSLAVPKAGRPAARAAFEQVVTRRGRRASATGCPPRRASAGRSPGTAPCSTTTGGVLMLGHAEVVAQRARDRRRRLTRV